MEGRRRHRRKTIYHLDRAVMTSASADRGIEHRAVSAALERLELYGQRDEALRALAAEHRDDDPAVAAAAHYVIGLRRVLAAGGAC